MVGFRLWPLYLTESIAVTKLLGKRVSRRVGLGVLVTTKIFLPLSGIEVPSLVLCPASSLGYYTDYPIRAYVTSLYLIQFTLTLITELKV
jgi:hypothetical protein